MTSNTIRKDSPTQALQPTSTPPPDSSTLRVIWHLCHLCNVMSSSINVYLSLEALARESSMGGMLCGPHVSYQPAMRAHALVPSDVCRNLETDRDTLLQSNMHFHYQQQFSSYRSLIDAANSIPPIIRMIPQGCSTFGEPVPHNFSLMPSKEVVDQIRNACDHVTELCVGNPHKAIVGWKVCWETIQSATWAKGG